MLAIRAYLFSLAPVYQPNREHELRWYLSGRIIVGLWKGLYYKRGRFEPDPDRSEDWNRGAYLVRHLGHCGECHTPRNFAGGLKPKAWLAGAPNPEGKGVIPNITPHNQGLAAWSANDVAYYLETGFTPEFDSAGGAMVAIQENIARLAADDRAAIAAYLKAVPARPNGYVKTDAAK